MLRLYLRVHVRKTSPGGRIDSKVHGSHFACSQRDEEDLLRRNCNRPAPTLERVQREPRMEALAATLEDPRVRFFKGDGRKMLSSVEKYDVIEADALRPDSAHAGALYSKEYFELAQARLKEGGMFVTWIPSQRVAETLVHVFPHVCIVGGMIGIGSSEKLNLQDISWRQRVQSTEVERHFLSAGVNILELVGAVFGPGQTVQQVCQRSVKVYHLRSN